MTGRWAACDASWQVRNRSTWRNEVHPPALSCRAPPRLRRVRCRERKNEARLPPCSFVACAPRPSSPPASRGLGEPHTLFGMTSATQTTPTTQHRSITIPTIPATNNASRRFSLSLSLSLSHTHTHTCPVSSCWTAQPPKISRRTLRRCPPVSEALSTRRAYKQCCYRAG